MNPRDDHKLGSDQRDRTTRDGPRGEERRAGHTDGVERHEAAAEVGTSDELIGSGAVGQEFDPGRYNDDDSGPGPRLMTASTLEGDDIVNGRGEDLGKIEDIMLDVPHGRIAYAVLSFGGFLGMGTKLFAIPWQALKLDPLNHRFVLDVSRERLDNAPGFDKDRWPDWADMNWAAGIHKYYGTKPYWE